MLCWWLVPTLTRILHCLLLGYSYLRCFDLHFPLLLQADDANVKRLKVRAAIKYLYLIGMTLQEIFCDMKETLAESALAFAMVAKLHAEFARGRSSSDDINAPNFRLPETHQLSWLPVLSNVAPPSLHRKAATANMLYISEDHLNWPVHADVFEHPPPWLASRRPIWSDMSSVDTITQWREDWSSASVVNHTIVTDPTIRQPGFIIWLEVTATVALAK